MGGELSIISSSYGVEAAELERAELWTLGSGCARAKGMRVEGAKRIGGVPEAVGPSSSNRIAFILRVR